MGLRVYSMRRRRNSNNAPKSVAIAVGIVLAAVFAGFLLYKLAVSVEPTDKLTGCPQNANLSPEHWVIVVDVTSPLSVQEKKALELFHEKIARTAQEKSRVRLYRLGESGAIESDRVVDVCSPGNPDQADPLYVSVEAVKADWEAKFRTRILDELDRIISDKGLKQSPIIESLNYISLLEFSQPLGRKKHLVIISDFVQNSALLNMYIEQPSFDDFRKRVGNSHVSARIEDVDVQLLYFASGQPALQGDSWRDFWVAYVASNGGRLVPRAISPVEKF